MHYPVYIDPPGEATMGNTLSVFTAVNNTQWDTGADLPVGYCSPDYYGCDQGFYAASFYQLNTGFLAGTTTNAHVDSASMTVREIWNGTSAATGFDLDWTQGISSSMGWPGPGIESELANTDSAAGSNGGNAANITFANATITNLFQTIANDNSSVWTFGLTDPGNSSSVWKRFDRGVDNSSYAPYASVIYNYPPSNPTNLTIVNACQANSTSYVNTPTATLRAQAHDNNPNTATEIEIVFYIKNSAGTEVAAYTAPATTSNTPVSWTTPALANGTYTFIAEAVSKPDDASAQYSSLVSTSFTIDTGAPAAPTLTNQTPALNTNGAYQTTIGNVITIHDPGALVIAYAAGGTPPTPTIDPTNQCNYTGTGPGSGFAPVDANGNATITITPPTGATPGTTYEYTNLTVQAYAINGLASPSTTWNWTSGNTTPLLYPIRVTD